MRSYQAVTVAAGVVSLLSVCACVVSALSVCACNELVGIREATGDWDGGPIAAPALDTPASDSGSSVPPPTDAATTTHPWADWHMPNAALGGLPNPQSYDTSTTGLVVDKITGLTWQATPSPDLRVWDAALAYCANLPLAGGGWRLPSRIELLSLVDYLAVPTIDPTAFPMTPADTYWTGSLLAENASYAWAVTFGFTVTPAHADAINDMYRVRCVQP